MLLWGYPDFTFTIRHEWRDAVLYVCPDFTLLRDMNGVTLTLSSLASKSPCEEKLVTSVYCVNSKQAWQIHRYIKEVLCVVRMIVQVSRPTVCGSEVNKPQINYPTVRTVRKLLCVSGCYSVSPPAAGRIHGL